MRAGRKPKKDVVQTERIFLRATAGMKQQVAQAAQVSAAGTITDYVQGLLEQVSPLVIDLNECRITPEQFKAQVAEIVYVLASPSAECEEGEDG